jgi:hypothetical protein
MENPGSLWQSLMEISIHIPAPIGRCFDLARSMSFIPVQHQAPANLSSPGEYNCQVTVLKPDTQKAAFWISPVAIGP